MRGGCRRGEYIFAEPLQPTAVFTEPAPAFPSPAGARSTAHPVFGPVALSGPFFSSGLLPKETMICAMHDECPTGLTNRRGHFFISLPEPFEAMDVFLRLRSTTPAGS